MQGKCRGTRSLGVAPADGSRIRKPRGLTGQKRGESLSERGGASPIPPSAVRVGAGAPKSRVDTQRAAGRPMGSRAAPTYEDLQRRCAALGCTVRYRTRHSQGGRCLELLRRTAPGTLSGGEMRAGNSDASAHGERPGGAAAGRTRTNLLPTSEVCCWCTVAAVVLLIDIRHGAPLRDRRRTHRALLGILSRGRAAEEGAMLDGWRRWERRCSGVCGGQAGSPTAR